MCPHFVVLRFSILIFYLPLFGREGLRSLIIILPRDLFIVVNLSIYIASPSLLSIMSML